MSPFESLETRRHFSFGTVITGYGTGGSSTAPTIGGSDNGNLHAVTVTGGKTLVAVGGGLTRFDTDGTLDTSFGTGGITAFRRVSFVDDAVDSSGRIYALVTGASGILVQRYTAAGRLDSTYGTSGSTVVYSGDAFTAKAIDVQSDGKVVVAGQFGTSGGNVVTRVYRLTASGSADTGFGSSGSTDFKLGNDDLILPNVGDTVADVRVLTGGQIEVLGSSYNYDNGDGTGNSVLAVARLGSGGTLVSSFGTSGVARRPTFDNADEADANAGVIYADGSAVVGATQTDVFNNTVGRSVYVGFSASGRAAYITYTSSSKLQNSVDATALADGRVAFVGNNGEAFFLSAAGELSNVVTPVAVSGANGIVANSTGDLVLIDDKSPYVRVTEIDAGKRTDPRPDDLPNAGAIGTAVDRLGGLHVAYYDTASSSLKYAYRDSQGYWHGIRTVDATVGAGAAVSIDTTTIKDRTNVAIAYYAAGSADLRIANSNTNGRKFAIQTVASRGTVGLSPSFHYTDSGGFAVSYYSKSTKSLYYALNNGDGWATEVVDSGGAGQYNELQFDPDSRRPAIAYTKSDNTVWYAFKGKGSTWADGRTKVATTTAGAAFVNLAIPNGVSYNGGPKISYYDLAGADLVLATFDRYADAGKRWSTQIIASRGVVGAYNDIVGPYQDATLFAWSKSGDTAYEYDYNPSSGNATAIPIATGGGQFLSVATDTYGTLYAIAYHDTASGQTFIR